MECIYALSYVEDAFRLHPAEEDLHSTSPPQLSDSTYLIIRVTGAAMAIFGKNIIRFSGIATLIAVEAYDFCNKKPNNKTEERPNLIIE